MVLSHSHLVDHRQFAAQLEALAQRYRVLAYDHRGHGQSDKPMGGYDLDTLCEDAVGFIEQTGAAPCHFVGLSTGGFVGMRLALRRPELLRSLVLMDTSADVEPIMARVKYEAMFVVLLSLGFGPLLGATMPILFGPAFLRDSARRDDVACWRERLTNNDPRALVRFGHGIFARSSVLEQLGDIRLPTLVMVGAHDRATSPIRAQRIADRIPGAELALIPAAGHLSTIDNPEAVNAALLSFFGEGRIEPRQTAPRSPRSTAYDGAAYGRLIEPLLAGVHRFVVEHLPPGDRVLDACCGTGGLARRPSESGRQVVGGVPRRPRPAPGACAFLGLHPALGIEVVGRLRQAARRRARRRLRQVRARLTAPPRQARARPALGRRGARCSGDLHPGASRSALRLDPHAHTEALDGVYIERDGELVFHPLGEPLDAPYERRGKVFERSGASRGQARGGSWPDTTGSGGCPGPTAGRGRLEGVGGRFALLAAPLVFGRHST